MAYEQSNRGSIEEQIVECVPALTAFARSFQRQQADVEDLVQETLVRALSNADRFERGTNLKSWLFTIMRNAFCSRYQRLKREVTGIDDEVVRQACHGPPQEWHVVGHELERACGALPEPYKSAFEFVFILGRSYDEAALHFHCPAGTVKSRVNRA
ncbi:sigma-70 family RNA polymerase sigma factor [Rhizobium sp. NPDC090275]|uniref:sigma-70 family RNA polymerase sigma factor n=1 Tax=Rhizobium sp. NPDC090275 TaxID=3364498 RepID=UPI00383A89BC